MKKERFLKPFGQLVENNDGNLTFMPNKLPPEIDYSESLVSLLSEADIQLGNLSGISKLVPNPDLLISPYLTQEAVLSSQIEGTQASILDVFNYEAGSDEKKETERKGVIEVVNYVSALNECLKQVKKEKQIDINMIKNAHKILMHNVRGQELQPGEFRTVQNYIGKIGSKIEDATYVPPPADDVINLMGGLVKFIQNTPGRIPVLIQCAMVHYLFEAIHPFGDGNGRIGRLLIPVLLAQRKLLKQPLLYLSAYIERNKIQYAVLLQDVSENSNWINWIRFFLNGIISQANEAARNIQELMNLKITYDEKLKTERVRGSAPYLVNYLFSNPIITIPKAMDYLGVTYPAAKDAIDSLKRMNILVDYIDRPRKHTFAAKEILSIIMKTKSPK